MSDLGESICFACGADLPKSLHWTASLGCHSCRDLGSPLRAELARREQESKLMRARPESFPSYSHRF
jgi:hypothetical protein